MQQTSQVVQGPRTMEATPEQAPLPASNPRLGDEHAGLDRTVIGTPRAAVSDRQIHKDEAKRTAAWPPFTAGKKLRGAWAMK